MNSGRLFSHQVIIRYLHDPELPYDPLSCWFMTSHDEKSLICTGFYFFMKAGMDYRLFE